VGSAVGNVMNGCNYCSGLVCRLFPGGGWSVELGLCSLGGVIRTAGFVFF